MYGRVDIVRHGRVVGIVLSPKAFEEMARPAESRSDWAAAHMIAPQKAQAARMIKAPGDFDD